MKEAEAYIEEHTIQLLKLDTHGTPPFRFLKPQHALHALKLARQEIVEKLEGLRCKDPDCEGCCIDRDDAIVEAIKAIESIQT